MEFVLEKCCKLIMKIGKRQITARKELPNQERTRTFVEKRNYKYLGMLEADIIQQAEKKEKITKSTTDERESFSKSSSAGEISSKR